MAFGFLNSTSIFQNPCSSSNLADFMSKSSASTAVLRCAATLDLISAKVRAGNLIPSIGFQNPADIRLRWREFEVLQRKVGVRCWHSIDEALQERN